MPCLWYWWSDIGDRRANSARYDRASHSTSTPSAYPTMHSGDAVSGRDLRIRLWPSVVPYFGGNPIFARASSPRSSEAVIYSDLSFTQPVRQNKLYAYP